MNSIVPYVEKIISIGRSRKDLFITEISILLTAVATGAIKAKLISRKKTSFLFPYKDARPKSIRGMSIR